MKAMKRIGLVAAVVFALLAQAASAAPTPWDAPAEALAAQIAAILGPGQAHLTIRNNSTLGIDDIPAIRRQLEADLKAHGITASGTESANSIRITLSENTRERLWVAEVVQGNETRVAMVHIDQGVVQNVPSASGLVLRKQAVLNSKGPILAFLELETGAVAVQHEEVVLYSKAADGWRETKRERLGQKRALVRDPRAVIGPSSGGIEIDVAGATCNIAVLSGQRIESWTVECHPSDDPWPIAQSPDPANITPFIKAFYNAARDYFTGVVTPSVGVDLPPFYTAALLPRPSGAALLIGGIDGKVQLVDNGALKPVAGTRDWGSDFAVLRSGCGSGTQIVASGSGEATSDSLRAYELPAQEAIPASPALAMDGTITALWTAPGGKSVYAVVRSAGDNYEVDRVTATCN